jgi:nucleotide-binding universal stress UspA family protein
MSQFKRILYVSEPAVSQELAFARAVSMAIKNQAKLTVIDVMSPLLISMHLPPEAPSSAELKANLVAERYNVLQSLTEPYSKDNQITLTVVEGKCFLEVIRTVLRDGHDLVIKPAENPDFIERLFGSDDMHLLRKCPCPVWLIKADEPQDYRCIMAALDFDPEEPASPEQGPPHSPSRILPTCILCTHGMHPEKCCFGYGATTRKRAVSITLRVKGRDTSRLSTHWTAKYMRGLAMKPTTTSHRSFICAKGLHRG